MKKNTALCCLIEKKSNDEFVSVYSYECTCGVLRCCAAPLTMNHLPNSVSVLSNPTNNEGIDVYIKNEAEDGNLRLLRSHFKSRLNFKSYVKCNEYW